MKMTSGVTSSAVESMLTAHPDVLRCVVITTTARSGERTLTAHYVLRPTATLCARELSGYLGQRLGTNVSPIRLRRHAMFPPTEKATVDLALMSG